MQLPPSPDQDTRIPGAPPRRRSSRWLLLLLLPYAGLLFPRAYARPTPELLGFPFFYWYQFGWVLLASAIMGLVFLKIKDGPAPQERGQ